MSNRGPWSVVRGFLLWSVVRGLWTGLALLLFPLSAQATDVCGTIPTTTWTLAGSPYIVTCTVSVFNDATLTIEPGVEVKFNANTGLDIGSNSNGTLLAQGTSAQPITFTANSASPTAGFWSNILFGGYASGTSRMEHCVIEYGGSGSWDTNVLIYSSPGSIVIQDSIIRYSDGDGIRKNFSTPILENNTITDNATYGVYLGGGGGIFQGNTVSNNGSYPLHLELLSFPTAFSGNTFTNNGIQAIELVGGVLLTNLTLPNPTLPYVITSSIELRGDQSGSAAVSLTIQPGTMLQFSANTGLRVGGAPTYYLGILNAQGTPEQPIIFTGTAQTPGFWNGLFLNGSPVSTPSILDYCVIEYGGADTWDSNVLIYSQPSQPIIQHSTIRYSDAYGVFIMATNPQLVLTENILESNGTYPLHLAITSFPTSLANNTFMNNGIQAIELAGGSLTNDLTLPSLGLPYVVTSDIEVMGYQYGPPRFLTLTPGTTLQFAANTVLRIGGSYSTYFGILNAQGTAQAPITFTGASPLPGFWKGIEFIGASTPPSILEHCVVEYGGAGGSDANIWAYASHPILTHTTVRQSDGYGILVTSGGSPNITQSNIIDNTLNGLESTSAVIGRLNWWGEPSGPSGAGPGSGDGISSNVLFEPWLGAPFTTPFGWVDAQESSDAFSQSGGATTLGATFSEPANWDLVITDVASAVVKTFGGTETQVAQDWVGDDTAGMPLPNGTYTYQWSATSVGTGQAIAPALGRVTLNDALPVAHIESPDPFEMLPAQSMLSVVGSAGGANFQSYTLEYGQGVLPTTWTTITSQTVPVTSGQLGIWDTTGLTQPVYTLRLRVVSTGGGPTATETVTVRLLDLANLSDAPDPFSPNSDGIDDTTTMGVVATYPVAWTLSIKDSANALIKTYTGSDQTISQVWDGTNQSGVLAPDGLYTYQFQGTETASGVSVLSPIGQVALQHISVTDVSVNPAIIDPFLGQQTSITYTLVHSLNLPMTVVVNLYNENTKQLTRTLTLPGQTAGPNNVVWDGKDGGGAVVPLEAYYFTIDATDAAGATDRYNDPVNPIPNSTTPNATQTTPSLSSFNPYQNDVVQIGYSLDMAARMTVRITNIPNNTTTIHTLVNGVVQLPGSHLEVWDGRLANGTFYQGPFNAFVDVPVVLAENAIVVSHPLGDITNFRTEAYLIQPTHREVSTLTYALSQDASVTITITDPNGSAVRTLLSGVAQSAGPQAIEWDGRTDSGQIVSVEGVYTVTLTGVDPVSGLSTTRLGVITVYK